MSKQHQKSEGLCNNREELTGTKMPFPNYPFQEWNPGPCKVASGHIPLSYHPVLRHLCNKGFTGLTWYGKKSPPCENFGSLRMLRHAAACCGMLQNPHQQLPESGAAACCGMLRHAATVGGWIQVCYHTIACTFWACILSTPGCFHRTVQIGRPVAAILFLVTLLT